MNMKIFFQINIFCFLIKIFSDIFSVGLTYSLYRRDRLFIGVFYIADAPEGFQKYLCLSRTYSANIGKRGLGQSLPFCAIHFRYGEAVDLLLYLIYKHKQGVFLCYAYLLGIGTKKGTLPKDDVDSDYKVKAAALQAGDLGSFKASNGTYTFTLANATNPKKTNATPISRFTNDFITHEEVVDGIAGFTTAIKVNSTTVNYKNIKVTVTVEDGKITNIKYSYAFDAVLSLKALVVNINGNGAAVTKAEFSNIKY